MQHTPIRITLNFTEKERDYFLKKASVKKQTLWAFLQWELNRGLAKMNVDEEKICNGKPISRKAFDIQLPQRLEKKVICISKELNIKPAQLLSRILFAYHLFQMIEEDEDVTIAMAPPLPSK